MQLLDELIKINDHGADPLELYKKSAIFKKYINLTYDVDMLPRYTSNIPFPKYKISTVPNGYDYSTLERQFTPIRICGFIDRHADIEVNIDEKRIVQLFESISEVEVVFLKSVLRKSVEWFSIESWRNANAIV